MPLFRSRSEFCHSLIALGLLTLFEFGCGARTNVLGLTVPLEHKKDFRNQIELAEAAYDRGDLAKAKDYATTALIIEPDSEEAAVIYGFISLALAGADPFGLARALIAAKNASTGGAATTLAALRGIVGLQQDELLKMGSIDKTVADLPLLIPACAEVVRDTVERLKNIDDAITLICPFVDKDVLNKTDLRQQCISTTGQRLKIAQAHFLWAFAHLTEAVAFNQVLTYGTVDPIQSNLQLRVARVTGQTQVSTDPAGYISAIDGLSNTMQAILPSSGICSQIARTTQFSATLFDLTAVDAAFARLSQAPASLRATLNSALGSIRIAQQQGHIAANSTDVLRGQFASNIADKVAASIDSQVAKLPVPLTADQKEKLCSSFENIARGSGKTTALCGGSG